MNRTCARVVVDFDFFFFFFYFFIIVLITLLYSHTDIPTHSHTHVLTPKNPHLELLLIQILRYLPPCSLLAQCTLDGRLMASFLSNVYA